MNGIPEVQKLEGVQSVSPIIGIWERNSLKERKCEQCNELFITTRHDKRFCSKECLKRSYGPGNILTVPRKNLGAYSELVVCADLLRLGYEVYRSISQHCTGDLMVEKDEIILKIEVRSAYHSKRDGEFYYSEENIDADVVALNFCDVPYDSKSVIYLRDGVITEM